jgi:hypothetical protein
MTRFSFPNQEGSFENNSWSMRSASRPSPTESQMAPMARIEVTAASPVFLTMYPSDLGPASRWWQGTQSAWNMGIDFFASGHIAQHQTIQRISILLLSFHLLGQNSSFVIMDVATTPLPSVWQLSAGVVFSVFLALVTSCPQEAVMLANFFVIFLVHCILPLSIPICTVMFLLELLTWEGAFRILALVWLVRTICTYFIHFLYRCL